MTIDQLFRRIFPILRTHKPAHVLFVTQPDGSLTLALSRMLCS